MIFNDNGKPDLAVANNGGFPVSILLGKPDGTFQKSVTIRLDTRGDPIRLRVGDLNGDRTQDLRRWQGNAAPIFLGRGDGTFQSPMNYDLGENGRFVTVGDFNGDQQRSPMNSITRRFVCMPFFCMLVVFLGSTSASAAPSFGQTLFLQSCRFSHGPIPDGNRDGRLQQ